MRKKRVLLLTREGLVPPENAHEVSDKTMLPWKAEYDVLLALEELGHEVHALGVLDDLSVLRRAVTEWQPHIVFNLLEEFHYTPMYESHVVSYLELLKQPYTGCRPRGLMIARDKVLSKKLLSYHRIHTPGFVVVKRGKGALSSVKLPFPLLVKSATEDASLGISQASVVYSTDKLKERIDFIHDRIGSDALVEEYIDGRELYVGTLGNARLEILPVWELVFGKTPESMERIATEKVKFDYEYQKRYGITSRAATKLPSTITSQLPKLMKRICKALFITGYARVDFRLNDEGELYVLEVNPNPQLSYGEDFAESARKKGLDYPQLIQKIVNLGLAYSPEWKKIGS